jgi:hypothetical protein
MVTLAWEYLLPHDAAGNMTVQIQNITIFVSAPALCLVFPARVQWCILTGVDGAERLMHRVPSVKMAMP